MSAEDEKFMKFGRMVFGMISDCLVAGRPGPVYARKTVTFPTNPERSAKGSAELIVTTDAAIADLFEKAVAGEYSVTDLPVSEKVQ